MKKALKTMVPSLLAVALVLSFPLTSQTQNREKFVISARAGGVNAVTGRAAMRSHGVSEWKQLTIKEDLETGDVVRTDQDARVEMLLNPGSYMRVGENSEFELADNSLDNLEVRLIKGTAIVEVTGAGDEELYIGITTPHMRMSIVRRGLYRVNVVPGDATELIVRKGRVMLEGSHTKVKGGNKVVFSNGSFSVAKLDKAEKKNWDALEDWSKDRAQTLAKANNKISRRMLVTFAEGFRSSGFPGGLWGRSGFWLFNADFGCYTFLPFGYGWGSPYGGFYSSSFYAPGYCCGRGPVYSPPVYGGAVGTSSSGTGSSGAGGSVFNPPLGGRSNSDSPMMGRGKPDLSPGGEGPATRHPIRE